MARTYIDMLNKAMVYQQAFNAAHKANRRQRMTRQTFEEERRADAELFGYTAAIADMFGKTHEDVRTDVRDFTEAVELREGK